MRTLTYTALRLLLLLGFCAPCLASITQKRAGSRPHLERFLGGRPVIRPLSIPGLRFSTVRQLLLSIATLMAAHPVSADELLCGSLQTAYGPFDYRTAKSSDIQMTESFHFTHDVETLKRGSTGTVGSDLHYTLSVFPNHYRALAAMMNLQFKTKTDKPAGAKWSVPCYFDRAIRFQPADPTVRTLFGVYLMRMGKTGEAVEQFENAISLGDDSGNLHYNLGLAYFELRDYDKSVAQARKAYDLGFTLPGLKEKLTKVGKWPTSR